MICDVKKCREETEYIYYGKKVCGKHWEYHCNKVIDLKKIFGIKKDSTWLPNPSTTEGKREIQSNMLKWRRE